MIWCQDGAKTVCGHVREFVSVWLCESIHSLHTSLVGNIQRGAGKLVQFCLWVNVHMHKYALVCQGEYTNTQVVHIQTSCLLSVEEHMHTCAFIKHCVYTNKHVHIRVGSLPVG